MKNATVILQVDRDDLFALFDQFLKERVQATKSDELWTAKKAAAAWDISVSKIRQIGAEHPEVIIRIGKAVRFDPDKLRDAIRKQKR